MDGWPKVERSTADAAAEEWRVGGASSMVGLTGILLWSACGL